MTLGIFSLILGALLCRAVLRNRKNYAGIVRFLVLMAIAVFLIVYGANRIRLDLMQKSPVETPTQNVIREPKQEP